MKTVPQQDLPERLLTSGEVAAMFRVDPKTVVRWAKLGRIGSIRTLGGHRRYKETEVRALLVGTPLPPSQEHAEANSPYRVCDLEAGVTFTREGATYTVESVVGSGDGWRSITTTSGRVLRLPALTRVVIDRG